MMMSLSWALLRSAAVRKSAYGIGQPSIILRASSDTSSKKYEDDLKDRSRQIPWEISASYLVSSAYNETYGDNKFWKLYRRNVSGPKVLTDTRKTCIKEDRLTTNNPCPICRDEYLVIHYRNIRLLEQFIKPYSGELLTSKETGVCQRKYFQILVAIEKAKTYGLLDSIDPHFVHYDYDYYKPSRTSY